MVLEERGNGFERPKIPKYGEATLICAIGGPRVQMTASLPHG